MSPLTNSNSLPDALYVTSPDYLGNVMDIKGLSEVCHKHGIPLLVDNAHGAYLAFLDKSLHPIHLGADMCCDSAHKTLPVLTGGAYLHLSQRCAYTDAEVRNTLSLFASTSPSYLILQSLDLCNGYLTDGYREKLNAFLKDVKDIKKELLSLGYPTLDTNDELKLVFSATSCGYTGNELANHLSKFKIEAEFADRDFLVLMLTPELLQKDLNRLSEAFRKLSPRKATATFEPMIYEKPTSCISIRDAMFSPAETISSSEALGRICASPSISCPPAVPIVISGETVNQSCIDLLRYYGIDKIEVIKQKNT